MPYAYISKLLIQVKNKSHFHLHFRKFRGRAQILPFLEPQCTGWYSSMFAPNSVMGPPYDHWTPGMKVAQDNMDKDRFLKGIFGVCLYVSSVNLYIKHQNCFHFLPAGQFLNALLWAQKLESFLQTLDVHFAQPLLKQFFSQLARFQSKDKH